MASLLSLRPLRSSLPSTTSFICKRCLSIYPSLQSGHNRWSKIKHDKMAADKKKGNQNAILSNEIALATKLYGPDPLTNSRLAAALATAKKAGFAKSSMESAIARGQGKSAEGTTLENLTLEIKFPPSIGMMIDIETDSKLRSLQNLRVLVKQADATLTPTGYLFTRKGRVILGSKASDVPDSVSGTEKGKGEGEASSLSNSQPLEIDDILEPAIEAGAEDVENEEDSNNIILWTSPSNTMSAARTLSNSESLKQQGIKLDIISTDIIWDANEDTKSSLEPNSEGLKRFKEFVGKLRDESDVVGIYANVGRGKLSDEEWEEVEGLLD